MIMWISYHSKWHSWYFSSTPKINSLNFWVSSRSPHLQWRSSWLSRMFVYVWMNWTVPYLHRCVASNCVAILYSMTLTFEFGWSHGQRLGCHNLCWTNMTMKSGHPCFGWPKHQCKTSLPNYVHTLTSKTQRIDMLYPSLLGLYVFYSD